MSFQFSDLNQDVALTGQYQAGNPGTGVMANWHRAVADAEPMKGFSPLALGRKNPARERRVLEMARLCRDVITGDCPSYYFQEALSPSDPNLRYVLHQRYPGLMMNGGRSPMGLREVMSVSDYTALYLDVLDRQYYGFYNAYPVVNLPLVRQHDLRDTRLVSRYLLDGLVTPFTATDFAGPAAEQALSGPVPQDNSTFPTTNTNPIQYQPRLYQARASVNWRAFVNDDLGIFGDIPKRLAIVANRGINKFITGLFFQGSGNGLNTALFSSTASPGYQNIIQTSLGCSANNTALSQQGLQDAFKVAAAQLDSSGNPILMSGKAYLVVGPSLVATANNLKNAGRVFVSVEGGNQNTQGFPTQFMETANWVMDNLTVIVDPYMPIVMNGATGTRKLTAWALVFDPGAQNRPAVEVGFLNGFKTPQMFRRMPNTARVGGGIDEMMGDFDSMDNDTKIVSAFGGTQIDGRSVVGSDGSGS